MGKYYRYMSFDEFSKLASGCDIIGKRHHKARTSSSGICFLGEYTVINSDNAISQFTFSPEQCLNFLLGIVTNDVLV